MKWDSILLLIEEIQPECSVYNWTPTRMAKIKYKREKRSCWWGFRTTIPTGVGIENWLNCSKSGLSVILKGT